MSDKQIQQLLNIPKKHTLRHYIKLVGELYGEPKESLLTHAEEQVITHEENLDAAIECYKGLIPDGHTEKKNKEEAAQRMLEAKKSELGK